MVALNNTVRLVVLQFSFSNSDIIPTLVKHLDQETQEERVERKNHSSGVMVIEPTEKCSLVKFLRDLEATEYEMVECLYKERIDLKDSRGKKKYHMVRFLFARREFVEPSEKFASMRDFIRSEFQRICQGAMWRVRAFSNPFYKNGEEISGQRSVSINLEARQPLFRPDGQPVTVWHKDDNGRRVGNTPLPLEANYYLHIVSNAVSLMTV